MFKNKSLWIIMISVFAAVVLVGAFAVGKISSAKETFIADGFILPSSDEEFITMDMATQYYFGAGEKYLEKNMEIVSFKDKQGKEVSVDTEQFLHYLDGSIGAFCKGVLLEADESLVDDQVVYYSVSKDTTLVKTGNSYSMKTLGDEMEMSYFIWKISDSRYLVASPEVVLHLSDNNEVAFPDYVQLEYVKEGIVRIIHQQGIYQTVSSEAYLSLTDGITLNLSGRQFFVDDEEGVKLASMVIGSEENVAVEENNDELKMPTFNVVNGANGANGTTGEDGDVGLEGEKGDLGDDGNDGDDGKAGKVGSNGKEGDDGSGGKEGESGIQGYDGKDGGDGNDAENSDNSGVVGVTQLQIPTISLVADKYSIGVNSMKMTVAVSDPNSLLTEDLKVALYNMSTYESIDLDSISKGSVEAIIDAAQLTPNTNYALIISGTYSKDGTGTESSLLTGDLFIKQFKTDSIGFVLEKVKAEDKSITFDAVFDDSSMVQTYKLMAEYTDADGTIKEKWSTTNPMTAPEGGGRVTFTIPFLDSNTEYTISAKDLQVLQTDLSNANLYNPNVSIKIKTLKETPKYEYLDNSNTIQQKSVLEVISSTSLNPRDKTLSVSIPALTDKDSGILGYRYELYETNNAQTLLEPVKTAESTALMVKSFDLEYGKSYTARVVVIFDDNEKIVEFETLAPPTTQLPDGSFPTVDYELADNGRQQDMLEMQVLISDPSAMLLSNVNKDYPIRVTFTNTYGDFFVKELYEKTLLSDNVASFSVKQDGLRKDTIYTITVTGPVNTTGTAWGTEGGLTPAQMDAMKDTFLNGVQYDTKQSALVDLLYYDISGTSAQPFSVAVNTQMYTADQYQAGDPEYVAEDNSPYNTEYVLSTINKMSFSLTDTSTGQVMGTASIYDISQKDLKHASEFYEDGFSQNGTLNPNTGSHLTLNPASFGLAESQVRSGREYVIKLTEVEDYVGNKLDYVYSSSEITVQVKERHVIASDPNSQISVVEITNGSVSGTDKYNPSLSDDTIIGIRLIPSYTLGDVLNLTYVAYEVTEPEKTPSATQDLTLDTYADFGAKELGKIKYSFGSEQSATAGDSYIGSAQYLNIYFGETRNDFDTDNDNLADDEITFSRGHQYFFRYEVETEMRHSANCHNHSENDIYPYCVYKTTQLAEQHKDRDEDVPFYRSEVYAALRQKPIVERYPSTSVSSSVTWKYRIFDPDGAVAEAGLPKSLSVVRYKTSASITDEMVSKDLNGDGKIYYDAANVYYDEEGISRNEMIISAGIATYNCPVVTDRNGAFTEVTFTGIGNNQRYRVALAYCLSAIGDNELIVSDIVRGKTGNDIPVARENEISYVNSVTGMYLGEVNDYGGGELRLLLYGAGVTRYSAIKVTVTGTLDGVTSSVVYDPVNIEIQNGSYENPSGDYVSFAYAYIDYAPIAQWQMKNVDIKVQGYYNTLYYGMKDFENEIGVTTMGSEGATSLMSKAYSLYNMSDGFYVMMDEQFKDVNISRGMSPSIYLADAEQQKSVYDEASGTYVDIPVPAFSPEVDNSYLRLQHTLAPLVSAKSNQIAVKNNLIAFDETGMYTLDGNVKRYISLEKLHLLTVGEIQDFYLEELLPTVSLENTSVGVKTANISFKVEGNVKPDTELFLELYNANEIALAIDLKGEIADSKNYYSTGNLGAYGGLYYDDLSSGDFNKSYADKSFKVSYNNVDNTYSYNVIITGLTPSSSTKKEEYIYRIYMHKTDESGNLIMETITDANGNTCVKPKNFYLYDTDYRTSGKQYTFRTLENVEMQIVHSKWEYVDYQTKSGYFEYAVEGAGMGYILKYSVKRTADNQVVVAENELPRLGPDEAYKHYGNALTDNAPIVLSLNPGNNVLRPGTAYIMTIKAYDKTDGGCIGTSTLAFNTPGFRAPTSKYNVVGATDSITVNYAITDNYKVIYNTSNHSIAGPYTMTVTYLDASGNTKEHAKLTDLYGNMVNKVFTGIPANTQVTVTVTAPVDIDNDANADAELFTDVFTGSTKSETQAVVTAYTDDSNHFVLSIEDCSNFEAVSTIKYTFYQDNSPICSGDVSVADLKQSERGGYYYVTPYKATKVGIHYVSAQFYGSNGEILGNELDKLFKVGVIY